MVSKFTKFGAIFPDLIKRVAPDMLSAMNRACQYCGAELVKAREAHRMEYACLDAKCANAAPFAVSTTEEAIANGFWSQSLEEQVDRLERTRKRTPPGEMPIVRGY